MLVLSRKLGQKIVIVTPAGVKVEVVVVDIDRKRIRLGIQADQDVKIDRAELFDKKKAEGFA